MIGLLLALHCGDDFFLKSVARQAAISPTRFEAVARVESGCNLNPRLRGHHCLTLRDCEIGRFQIKPSTARLRCRGLNIRRYHDNVVCAAVILQQNIRSRGMVDGTRVFNGTGPATYEYLYKVLKTEETP